MLKKRTFRPNILIHPWMTLKDILEYEGISIAQLAERTHTGQKNIEEIINGEGDISSRFAIELEKQFWISSIFWNNMQKWYEEDKLRLKK